LDFGFWILDFGFWILDFGWIAVGWGRRSLDTPRIDDVNPQMMQMTNSSASNRQNSKLKPVVGRSPHLA
jgi:hypothetical protein